MVCNVKDLRYRQPSVVYADIYPAGMTWLCTVGDLGWPWMAMVHDTQHYASVCRRRPRPPVDQLASIERRAVSLR